MKNHLIRHIGLFTTMSIILGCILMAGVLHAQTNPGLYEYPRNHLPWYTIESEHFRVHFQEGSSRSGRLASRIAEEIYPEITRFYDLSPDSKTDIVLRDREDYSNGAAFFFDNRIEIWIPALNSPLRGDHDWMQNVIAHEFTHIVQLQAAMKRTRRIPAIYFQWLSYEDVRRPDVLYGFPNGLISYPFSSISVPGWFAEGTAQFQRIGWSYDTWDSYRDMVLRIALLNETELEFHEMGIFSSKTALEREMVYNHGFDFTIYLVERFGENVLAEITRALGRSGKYRIDRAIEEVTGHSGIELYTDWIEDRREFYYRAIEHMNFSK
ncbi:MAG: hypothetical protein R3211_04970, partial [Balneolaceae bacterium]|nr:hypothetical protein [Balneolaceae bacterium]